MFDLVELTEQSRKAAGIDMTLATGHEALAAVTSLAEVRSLIDAADAHALARLDSLGVTDTEFGLSTGTWLARETGLSGATARARVKVSKGLAHLAVIDQALVDGLISWDHVRVLTEAAANPRVGHHIVELQGDLVAMADGVLFEHWRSAVLALVELLDADGPKPDDLDRNKLSLSETLDGTFHLGGSLTKANGEIVTTAVNAMADELFLIYRDAHKLSPDKPIPNRATLRALAMVELCRRGQAVDLKSSRPPRPEVSLVINPENPETVTRVDGTKVNPAAYATLLCDPDFTAIIVNSLGVPLDMGHTVRLATATQRRAIAIRDGGCVFPGCEHPIAWADLHHVEHHEHGGPTDLPNLAPLCRTHHGITHRKDWVMHTTPDGWFWWQTPTGHKFWSQRHQRKRHGPLPPFE